jgi:hypothetical protein
VIIERCLTWCGSRHLPEAAGCENRDALAMLKEISPASENQDLGNISVVPNAGTFGAGFSKLAAFLRSSS